MNEQQGRERLALLVQADRGRIYRTVDRARIEAGIARGAWDRVETGQPVKDFTLAAVEKALGWPAGRAKRIVLGIDDEVAEPGPSENLRTHVLREDLPPAVKRAMIALLDSIDEEEQEPPPAPSRGVRGA